MCKKELEGTEAKMITYLLIKIVQESKTKEFNLPPFSDFSEMLDIFQHAFIWSAFL